MVFVPEIDSGKLAPMSMPKRGQCRLKIVTHGPVDLMTSGKFQVLRNQMLEDGHIMSMNQVHILSQK